MTPTYLYDEGTKEELKFNSITEAAKYLGVPYQRLLVAVKKGMKCHGYIVSIMSKKRVEMKYDLPREELDIPHYATIDGKEFVAVKCTDKTNCTKCDIFKLDPPWSMMQSPLCYEHNCGNRKIVDICARYKCIWKRK